MWREFRFSAAAVLLVVAVAAAARGEVTAQQVNEAIDGGVKYLLSQQHGDGHWTDHELQPGGLSALCTLALLNSGLKADHPDVKEALAYLERIPDPEMVYSASLQVMVFTLADPVKYTKTIRRLALWIEAAQVREGETKGGWSYSAKPGRSDNSNTQFAMLALHEAERAGVQIKDQTWQLALNYWLSPGMQKGDGSFGYEKGHPSTGSMTCAAIASIIMAQDRLQAGDATVQGGIIQCCGGQSEEAEVERALAWLGKVFRVSNNPGERANASNPWLLYYLYGVERIGRMSGQRKIGEHDWYREGCEFLVGIQDKFNHGWKGVGYIEANQLIGTSFALLFLSKGKRPVVLGKLKHSPQALGGGKDWDLHRRAVQNLTWRVERAWQRDLSWQTIELRGASVPDLLEAPVLFMSGSESLRLSAEDKRNLREYVNQGGFIFAEACDGDGCDGAAFDRDFRALLRELFPESSLRKLPPDHAVWFAQQKVIPAHLPQDSEFWLWGLDACCRTSVIYCPRSLSCRWELSHPYRDSKHPQAVKDEIEACVRIGENVLAYATNRELKDKLERPQVHVSTAGGKVPRGALSIPKLSHGGGSDDAPNALANLMLVLDKQLAMRVDYERRMFAPSDPKLLDYPLVFAHGRRAFKFTAAERKALQEYLQRGGFLFADAICASPQFAESLRSEIQGLFPDARFTRIPPSHPLFTSEFGGFDLPSVTLRDPQARDADDPLVARLTKSTPLLEALEIDGRIAVILSPYDLSCALEKGASMECKGYTPADAARIGANIILYALQQ